MQVINVAVSRKIASANEKEFYVCGNSDYIIRFAFDEEWNEYNSKTARFEYDGKHEDVIFSGNECPVPIISNVYNFKVGIYAGDLRTTTPAYIAARKSILCGESMPATPEDYTKPWASDVMAAGDAAMKAAQEAAESAEAAQETADAIAADWESAMDVVRSKAPAILLTASGILVTVTNAAKERAVSIVSQIGPTQTGSGDPDKDNVRDFVGYDTVRLYREAEYSADAAPALTAELPETVYGGTINWSTGELTITHILVSGLQVTGTGTTGTGVTYVSARVDAYTTAPGQLLCNRCRTITTAPAKGTGTWVRLSGYSLYVYDDDIDDSNPQATLDGLTVCYPVTPRVVQLAAQHLELLEGKNNIWSDSGDTALRYVVDTKVYVDGLMSGGGTVTDEQIQQAVDKYLTDNPVQVEETDPTVPDWAKSPTKPTYTAEDVGAQPKGDYALKSEIPAVPVQSVNGKAGEVKLTASDVGALPESTQIPPAYSLPTASADTLGGVKVGEGLQMDGDVLGVVPEGRYELIETIALEEDVAIISRDAWPDGTPYALKKIAVEVTGKTTSGANVWLNMYPDSNGTLMTAAVISGTNANYKSTLSCELDCGRVMTMGAGPGLGVGSYNANVRFVTAEKCGYNNGIIDRIVMKMAADVSLAAGTTIVIWGVRANA